MALKKKAKLTGGTTFNVIRIAKIKSENYYVAEMSKQALQNIAMEFMSTTSTERNFGRLSVS